MDKENTDCHTNVPLAYFSVQWPKKGVFISASIDLPGWHEKQNYLQEEKNISKTNLYEEPTIATHIKTFCAMVDTRRRLVGEMQMPWPVGRKVVGNYEE